MKLLQNQITFIVAEFIYIFINYMFYDAIFYTIKNYLQNVNRKLRHALKDTSFPL